MTRLLVPEMFGVMAIANLVLFGLALFSDVGIGQGIVQSRRGHDPVYLNTSWTVQIIRGIVIWLLALTLALVIYFINLMKWFPSTSTYADPILPYVVAILSINALIDGFNSTRIATANRNLMLGRLTMIELSSQVGAIIFMVIWAFFYDRSIWALVAGAIMASAIKLLLGHTMLSGEKNFIHWDWEAFHEIFHFGKWIFMTSIMGFLAMSGDRILLGGFLSPATLGLYATAYFMVSALRDVFAKLASNVVFPALGEVARERPEALLQTYYRFRFPVDIICLFSTGLLFAAGHLVVDILYDDRYKSAGHMLEILSISLIEVRYSLVGQCFMAMGMPKLLSPAILVRLVALFTLLPLAYKTWGLDGALWVAASSAMFSLPVTFYLKVKYGLFDLRRELIVLPALGAGYVFGCLIDKLAIFL